MYDWVLNKLLEGFVQEVAVASVLESLTTWQKYHL